MKKEDVFALDGNNPVMLADGRMGMLIRFPGGYGDMEGMCGVQVFGEEDILWIHHDELSDMGGGALKQIGT